MPLVDSIVGDLVEDLARDLIPAEPSAFFPLSADFDGSNDYTSIASISGLVNGKQGTVACWIQPDNTSGTAQEVFMQGSFFRSVPFQFFLNGNRRMAVAAGTEILSLTADTQLNVGGSTWYHVYLTWDLSKGTAVAYINGSEDTRGTPTTTNDTIDYTSEGDYSHGNIDGVFPIDARLAEFVFDDSYNDPTTVISNFISGGSPVDPGSDGSGFLGFQPLVYNSVRDGEAASAFANNRGSAGNFTITGALELGGSPSV